VGLGTNFQTWNTRDKHVGESHAHGEALMEMSSANDTWEKKLLDPSATPMFLSFEFLKAITCDFSIEQKLGRCGYAVVYKVRHEQQFSLHLSNVRKQ
jgi:hypothetical protein